jgi:ribosomal-protein-serine acetyltransferase
MNAGEYLYRYFPWMKTIDSYDVFALHVSSCIESMLLMSDDYFCIFFDDILIGLVSYHGLDDDTPVLSYYIKEEYSGNGIMTKCCLGLNEYVFDFHDIDSLEVSINENNLASLGVARKLGFELFGSRLIRNESVFLEYNAIFLKREKIKALC